MTSYTWKHSEEGCPAYPYCKALESYGITLGSHDCLLKSEGNKWYINDEILASIEKLKDNRAIALALAQEAVAQLNYHESLGVDFDQVNRLIAAREDIFQARLNLWTSMIEATRNSRIFTDVELRFLSDDIEKAQKEYDKIAFTSSDSDKLCAQCAHDRKLKNRYSLQFDDEMIEDINRLVSNILNSRPTLIVGDKGIAKTQVAKFVMSLYNSEPIVISVKGDMMSDELIGKIKHDREQNTFVFQEGILLTAMRAGLPVLLDEINFGDQAIIARLQDILLKQAGESVFVQESGDETIEVAPGFIVFATANEASARYRHREILDPAIRDRFDIVIRAYPDLDIDALIDTSPSLLRIALSSAVDSWGVPSTHIDMATLEMFVRLAHATQYLYAVPGKEITIEFADDHVSSSVSEDSQPLMTDCITPRTVSKTIADCAAGNLPGIKLDSSLIEGMLEALDQAGSRSNLELAEQVAVLLDLDNQTKGEVQDEENESLSDTKKLIGNGPFSHLSDQAFHALLAIRAQS